MYLSTEAMLWTLTGLVAFGAITGVGVLVHRELASNSEAPLFALLRYTGRTVIRDALRDAVRLGPVVLVSAAILLLLTIPVLEGGSTSADRAAIEAAITTYFRGTSDRVSGHPVVPGSVDATLRPVADDVRRQGYRDIMLGELSIAGDIASGKVRLTRDDGTADWVVFTCRRDGTRWRIWTAGLEGRITLSTAAAAR